MPAKTFIRASRIATLISIALLAACGGGGGGGGGSSAASTPVATGSSPNTNNIVPATPNNNASFTQCPTTPAAGTGAPSTTAALKGRITFDRIPFLNPPPRPSLSVNGGQWATGPGLDYPHPVITPARGVVVEAVAATSGTCEGTVVDTAITNGDGWYALNPSLDQTVCVRVRAQLYRPDNVGANWNFSVVDNTSSNQLYAMTDSQFATARNQPRRDMHAGSGWAGTFSGARTAAPFAILDTACKAMDAILAVQPTAQFGTMTFRWSTRNTESSNGDLTAGQIGGAFYSSAAQAVYLRGDATTNTDEFDEMVIAHEFGHFITDRFGRSDSTGGDHSLLDNLDPRLAFDEGWATAFAGLALGSNLYRDSDEYSDVNHPAREYYFYIDGMTYLPQGWFTEASVQKLIYSFGETTNADGVGLGLGPILEVFTGYLKTNDALATLFNFSAGLKMANPTDAPAISSLISAESISGATINDFALGETHAPDTARDLPIYKTLNVGSISPVCSSNVYASTVTGGNKLSVIRYLRFDAPSNGNFKITATPQRSTGLAGLRIYQQGRDIACSSGNSNIESLVAGNAVNLTCPMSAAPYVVAIYQTDFSNDSGAAAGNYDQCFAVKAEAQ